MIIWDPDGKLIASSLPEKDEDIIEGDDFTLDCISNVMEFKLPYWFGFRNPLFYGGCKLHPVFDSDGEIEAVSGRLQVYGNLEKIRYLRR